MYNEIYKNIKLKDMHDDATHYKFIVDRLSISSICDYKLRFII